MNAITPVTAGPGSGLFVLCLDCTKEFRSSELQGQRCLKCRVHRACDGDRVAIAEHVKKQQRYAASGATVNPEQLERLRRRLFGPILALVGDPNKAVELAEDEWQAAMRETPLNRFRVSREEAVTLHPDLRRVRVASPRLSV